MRRTTTYAAAVTLIAVLALPFRASPFAATDAQVQSVAQDVAAACAEQTELYRELTQLQERQALLRQIVANYGFTNTAAEFDAATEFLTERERASGQVRRAKDMKKDLYDKTVAAAKKDLGDFIEGVQRSPELVGSATPQFVEIVRKLPMSQSQRDQIMRLASDPATRLRAYGTAFDWIDKAVLPLELMEAAEDGALPLAWKGFMEAASVISPAYGRLLTVIDWAGNNLYNAVTGQWTAHQIRTLTASTEADLASLKQRTDQLKQIALDLKRINARSPELARRCDTTRLTREASQTTTSTPTESMPEPAAKKSGPNTTLLLGLTALSGGLYAASTMIKPKDCGEAPLDEYYDKCPGSGCSTVRAKYEKWCTCNDFLGFDGNACY